MEIGMKKAVGEKLEAARKEVLAAHDKTSFKYTAVCGGKAPVEPFTQEIQSLLYDMRASREMIEWLDNSQYNLQSMSNF